MQVQSTIAVVSEAGVMFAEAKVVPAVKREAPEVVRLHRVNLRTLIMSQDGLFVSVDFEKQGGMMRTLTGRLGVTKYLKGGKNKVMAAERPYLTVFDVQLLQYRTVDLATVTEIRAERKIYRVID